MQCYVVGPEGSGKTSLCVQLRSLFQENCVIWPPERLDVAPTAGQELYTITIPQQYSNNVYDLTSSLLFPEGKCEGDANDRRSGTAACRQLKNPAATDFGFSTSGNEKLAKHMKDSVPQPPPNPLSYKSSLEAAEASLEYCEHIAKRHEKLSKAELVELTANGQETIKESAAAAAAAPSSSTAASVCVDIIEIGGKMCSVWSRFLSKGSFRLRDDVVGNAKRPSLLLYVVDANSPGQLPMAAMELHNLLETFFPWLLIGDDDDDDARSCGWCPTLNVLRSTQQLPPANDKYQRPSHHNHCRVAVVVNRATSSIIGGNIGSDYSFPASEADFNQKVDKSSQKGTSSSFGSGTRLRGGGGKVDCNVTGGNSREMLLFFSRLKTRMESLLMLPRDDSGESLIPVILADSWYGTGLGDLAVWLASQTQNSTNPD